MNNFTENLQINRVIIHKIHKRNIDKSIEEPEYNNNISNMRGRGLMVFKNRVINAIGSDSCSLQMDIYKKSEGTTFDYVKKSINSSNIDFIENSKKITYKLAEAQISRTLPGGIVVVFDGTIGEDSKSFIGIIKAEPQEGFKLEGLSLDYIEDLILTKNQKFYKIGLFIKNSIEDLDDYLAVVYDSNLSKINSDAAYYFYNSFLGCKKCESDQVLNKEFYIDTRDFINCLENISDEEKLDLNYGLYSYMNTERNGVISINNFSEKFFTNELKNKYKSYMEEKGIPSRNIGKDINLLSSILKNRRINFTNDIQLVAPSENFKNVIEMKDDGEKTVVIIKGSIVKQI